jgi:TolB protein
MTTAGGSQTRLTNDPHTDREPSWSPDGSKIAFSSDRVTGNGGFEIYVMGAPNGNSQTRLTTLAGEDSAPFWLDSTRIVFSSAQIGPSPAGGLAVVPSVGGTSTKISGTVPGDRNPG